MTTLRTTALSSTWRVLQVDRVARPLAHRAVGKGSDPTVSASGSTSASQAESKMCPTMRRRARANRSGLLVLAVGVIAAAVPRAKAAQLSVDAPESCLDPSTLADEVGDLIGKPLGSVADVDFRIQISETPQRRWRLRLEMLDQRPGGDGTPAIRGSREIEGATCAELAEAASVAIAVSVRSISPETAAADRGRPATPDATPAPSPKALGSLGRT